MEIYIVKQGDTVSGIAAQYGISIQRLIADNGLEEPGRLVPGQALIILIPELTYTVRPDDTLNTIAATYGTTIDALLRNNPWLTAEPLLQPGRVITIRFEQSPIRTSRINGYAYPFISRTLLSRELPYLSTLTIFGYGFTESGELIAPDDDELLEYAQNAGVAPILLLSSITETGNFSSSRASALFQSNDLQTRVLSSLLAVMGQKGYRGLDIDFEYVLPEDADAFIAFVEYAAELMHENGYFVNVDLAPKESVDQKGLLYEAHDYAALGAAADTVLLMTYEWGYTYGPPMAVAPIRPVSNVVNFALTQIPSNKIMLGIPNYGYDWQLPFEKGITQATPVGNQYAVTVASRLGVPIRYDEVSQSPFYTYIARGFDHIVWFEDVRSIAAKLNLVTSNNLLGIGYWNLMRPFAQNWSLLSVTLTPQKV